MTSKFIVAALSVLAVSYFVPAHADECTGKGIFRTNYPQAAWRSSITNYTGDSFALSTGSEQTLKRYKQDVYRAVYNDQSTLQMEIEAEQGLKFNTLRESADYGTGIFPKYEIQNSRNGKVGIILGLPVSGHAGTENARRWSTTDKYNIRLEKEVNGSYVTEQLIKGQQSLDTTTFHELTLQMDKGVNYRLSYWRDGSAGPYGFREGRFVELVWNGN